MFEKYQSARRAAGIALGAFVLLFVATACQQANEPSADQLLKELEPSVELAASFAPDLSLRARYLPPIGSTSQLVGEFANGLPVEVAVFALSPDDTQAIGTALRTFPMEPSGVLTRNGDTYRLAWPVFAPSVAERIRVEIRMPGSGDLPVCNEYEGECLGYVNVRIVEQSGKGRGGGSSDTMISVSSGSSLEVSFKVLVAQSLEELAALSGQGGLDPEARSCPADEVALPSQGLQAVGAGLQAVGAGLQAVGAGLQAVGAGSGLFAAPLTELSSRLVSPAALDSIFVAFDGELDDTATKGGATALFVLDDFGGSYQLPAGLLEDDLDALMAGANPLTDTLGYSYSHGALVFHQLRTLLESLLGKGKASPTNNPYYIEFGSKAKIRLQAVDARDSSGHIDTDVAALALKAAMQNAYNAGFRRAVVNMSFAIVPCTVLEDFSDADTVTFEDYVMALLAYNGVTGQTAQSLAQTVQEPVEALDDALLDHLECPQFAPGQPCGAGFQAIVNVAASGNYGLDFALFPAAAPGVVSVGSQGFSGTFGGRSEFSNAATVVAAGDVILLRADEANALAYIGTSFSAPIASLFIALDQRKASPNCAAGNPADPLHVPPALSSTDLNNVPLLPGFTPSGDPNAPAVVQYCSATN
ncbi:MAG TPA: S8 family serine peptidase [Trueperaceae bacterium]